MTTRTSPLADVESTWTTPDSPGIRTVLLPSQPWPRATGIRNPRCHPDRRASQPGRYRGFLVSSRRPVPERGARGPDSRTGSRCAEVARSKSRTIRSMESARIHRPATPTSHRRWASAAAGASARAGENGGRVRVRRTDVPPVEVAAARTLAAVVVINPRIAVVHAQEVGVRERVRVLVREQQVDGEGKATAKEKHNGGSDQPWTEPFTHVAPDPLNVRSNVSPSDKILVIKER